MLLNFYQHIPEYINPIAFSVGFFSVRWYSLMYLAGLGAVYWILMYRVKRGEYLTDRNYKTRNPNSKQNVEARALSRNVVINLLSYLFVGLLIGGRLGYVLFYDLNYFIQNPLEIFLPLNIKTCYMLHATCYTGFYGMSYHGGLIGAILGGIIFAKRRKISFWKLADWIVPAVPAGYFFGRLGNFLNGELYGRVTDMPWGMYFRDGILRHPSQLYEAFFEGIVLFIILRIFRRRSKFSGYLFIAYLFGYGLFRFILEFFREPDVQLGFVLGDLTMGQILSIGMVISSLIIFCQKKRDVV